MADQQPLRSASTMPPVERITDELEKPELDDRSYRVIRLQNDLEALLVHDPDTDKASASVNVNVGSFFDPDDMPGMAHAVEHLLFMGTKKFSEENAYNQYLSSHSGHSNAYTSSIETNYFFEVAAHNQSGEEASDGTEASTQQEVSPFYGALDRFAQFFVAPLFLASTLDRELQAVDSENKKNLQSDDWRLSQLNKALANPKHPYSHFSTGNLHTLSIEPRQRGINVRDEFIKFYEQHYSANRMKLVVLGREPLDVLETWVAELFSEVKNKNLTRSRWDDVELYGKDSYLTQVFAKPVMESRSLDISFPYKDEEDMYETQPSRYISHLIGHEGPGSILSYIKGKGWANGLSAGSAPVCPGSAFFSISIRLTEDGLKHYKEITEVVFQYIAMLKEIPPQKWIVDEIMGMSAVDFRFREKSPAISFTKRLSSVMQKPLPRDKLLSGYSVVRSFDAEAIRRGLGFLKPDNYRLTIVSQTYPGNWDKREKWYGTEYKVEKIPQEMVESISKAARLREDQRIRELHLPHTNEFVPSRLAVEKKEGLEKIKIPKLIRNDEGVRTWWKKDDTFWVPKANVFIHLRNPIISSSPATFIKARFYCELVKDSLEDYTYDAEIAGLEYRIASHSSGLDIGVYGYNDKLQVLLKKVLTRVRDLEVKPDRFEIMKERLSRSYRNFEFTQPYRQASDYLACLRSERGWTTAECGAEIASLTPWDIKTFFAHVCDQMHIEVFVHGNLYKEDALNLTSLIESCLTTRSLPKAQWPTHRTFIIPPGSNFVYQRTLADPKNVNHCTSIYCYVGETDDSNLRGQVDLFAQMIEEPAFDQLRTKEQLGYIVFTHAIIGATTMGISLLIQSERNAVYLEERIDSFLVKFADKLSAMTDEEFGRHKRSVITRKLQKLKSLDEEFSRMYSSLVSERYDFLRLEEDAEIVKNLTKPEMIAFYEKYIDPHSEHRAKLSVHMSAQTAASEHGKIISVLERLLDSKGVAIKSDAFKAHFSSIDFTNTISESIATAIQTYLLNEMKMPNDQVQTILYNSSEFLKNLVKATAVNGTASKEGPFQRPATIIEDIHDFKVRLRLSKGPVPVKPLSEFEDIEPKL